MTKQLKAFSLIELLLGVALFGLLISSVVALTLDSVRSTRNAGTRVFAAQRIREVQNALIANKDSLWSAIVNNTDAGDFHMEFADNKYSLVAGSGFSDEVTLSLAIEPVYRDVEGNIAVTGQVDLHTRKVVIAAVWIDFLGVSNNLESIVYVSDWTTLKAKQTTEAEFLGGTANQTIVTNNQGGEIQLTTAVYANWCNPSITLSAYDLPGQGIAQSIYVIPGNIFMGTGSNASGVSFARLSFVPATNNPSVSTLGTFDGYKTTTVYSDGSYGYLATETNGKEVVIVNTTSLPYVESGYYDTPINGRGKGLYIYNNVGFVGEDNKIYSFDLSSKAGSRPGISSITLSGNVVSMFGRGSYIYVVLSNSSTELQVVNVSNPSAMTSAATIEVNNVTPKSVYVNEAETRAYIVTAQSASYNEFYIVDVTNKSGTKVPLGSYDAGDLNPTDVTAPEGSNRAIIVGTGGTQQYQVFNIQNENAPVKCGGIALPTGANALFSLIESNGNAYSYIVTGEASSELKVIRGGAGGGNGMGIGVLASGDFESSVIDTESDTTQYYAFDWIGTVPANSTIKFQMRSGSSAVITSPWIGPDGTAQTYFTTSQSEVIPALLSNNRYYQYKVFFTSEDTIATAILDQVSITYQK